MITKWKICILSVQLLKNYEIGTVYDYGFIFTMFHGGSGTLAWLSDEFIKKTLK